MLLEKTLSRLKHIMLQGNDAPLSGTKPSSSGRSDKKLQVSQESAPIGTLSLRRRSDPESVHDGHAGVLTTLRLPVPQIGF